MKAEIMPIYGQERLKLSSVIPLSTPFTVDVFPTNICNFHCNYCIQSVGAKRLREEFNFPPETMKMSTFSALIDQIKDFPEKIKLLSMMGHGEPLINSHLPEMIALAKNNRIAERIEIISNGSLLTKKLGLELLDAGLDCIRISLQGLSAVQYISTSAVKIDFEEFVDNIRFFYKHRRDCKVFVKVMDISLGAGEDSKFYQAFEDICDRMYIERVMPVYDGVNYATSNITMDRYGRQHEKRMICPLCFFTLSVWPDGSVYPCDAFHRPLLLGNINLTRLIELWNGQDHIQFCIKQLKKERSTLDGCKSCCAPDDVSQPEDVLDQDADQLINTYSRMEKIL